jgi:sensor c-di-GMP phosphodiesterase-like protein
MRKKITVALFSFAGIATFIVPLILSLSIAWVEGQATASQKLERIGADILRRSTAARAQIDTSIDTLLRSPQQDPCSQNSLKHMREVIAGAAYIQGIGIAEGQRLLCSTITHLEEPLDLGMV